VPFLEKRGGMYSNGIRDRRGERYKLINLHLRETD